MPDTHDPQPPDNGPEHKATSPTDVSDEEYHEHSDRYMESLNEKAEAVQEGREDVEVDFSVQSPPSHPTKSQNKRPG